MAYEGFYPGGWKDDPEAGPALPGETPVSAAALEHADRGIREAHDALDGRLSERELNATYVPMTAYAKDAVIATVGAFPGLDPTGVTDSSAALQAAVAATPDGARLIVPAGIYRVDTGVSITDRTITVDSYGVTYRKATDGAIFAAAATVDTVYPVSALAQVTVSDENTAAGQRLTLAGNTGWERGDIVQLISDDVIPGGLPGDGTNEYRCGQHFMVHAVTSGSVDLLGSLHDPMSTNLRVHRMRRHLVRFRGGRFTKTGGGSTIASTRLVAPVVEEVNVYTSGGQALSFAGCVGWRAMNFVVENAPNVPASGIFGYGIMNMSSSWGRVSGAQIHRVRHAYTNDNTAIPAGSAQYHLYGRPFGNTVENSVAIGTDNSAWDTHSGSQAEQFINCDAIDCYNVYGLRGRGHSVQGGKVTDCLYLLRIFSQTGSNSESWGHMVDGIQATRIRGGERAIRIDVNPVSGIRETRKSFLRNITIDGVTGHVIDATNATFDFDGLTVNGAAVRTANAAVFQMTNSVGKGTGVRMDQSGHTSGTGQRFAYMAGASVLEVDRARWDFPTGSDFTRIVVRASGATDTVRIADMELSGKPTAPYDTLYDTNSYVDYSGPTNDSRGSLVAATREAIADAAKLAPIGYSRAPVVQLQLHSNDNPYTLGALPAGRYRGQMLVMFVLAATTQAITVPHDAAKKIQTKAAANLVLNAGGTAQFVWNTTNWVQV
ncbi:hypothetical protein GTA26_04580 [Rhodococcus hoagii]|nr:hypothetical protein [Prescottella equi]NKZ94698.1 hypothetical protein [Prescottella equi]